ncbi:MAG: hypothetical protein RBU45_19805 [Myxococcota bacterium]|jgi:hypothetical protein|nr:hypothetical protein [Myxococcota bacterium]
MKICHSCKQEVDLEVQIGRDDVCANCYADLHVCFNCKFYDPGRQNECMEPHAGFVRDRERANFCHFFTFKDTEEEDEMEQQDARSRLEALFKGLK